MKVFILSLFYFGINANKFYGYESSALRPGFLYTCGITPVEKVIGPIQESGKQSQEKKVRSFAKDNGNGLIDNEEYVTNEDNYVYPCDTKDYECIRQFFQENAECKRIYGPVTDPLYVPQQTLYSASVNISAIYYDVEYGGLSDAFIYSMFYNKKTRYAILAIELPILTIKSPKLCFEYYRPGEESIIKCDCANIAYKSLIITAEFPGLPKCRLDLADIHGYGSNIDLDFVIGPNISNSTDPTVTEAYAALLENIPTIIRENIEYQAPLLFAKYMQSYICDFNLKICSV